MAKKRGDGPRGDDISHQVRHQGHQGHQGHHGHHVRQQQLHQPAPLHQHQLQVKVRQDNMAKILAEHGNVHDGNGKTFNLSIIRVC